MGNGKGPGGSFLLLYVVNASNEVKPWTKVQASKRARGVA